MLLDGSSVIALIPARGGSKGIPRKNLAILDGIPLIGHTIRAAQESMLIDSVWVSSDDEETLGVAKVFGAQSLTRPYEFANDTASSVDVVKHFLNSGISELKDDSIIVYLQPTSPLRNGKHVDLALYSMALAEVDAVISVVEAEKPPQKAFSIDANGNLKSLFDERLSNARRQDLPPCYFPNGAIYAFRVHAFNSRDGFPSNGSVPYVMQASESIDIDSEDDFARAEIMIRKNNGSI